jgi:TonB family protein
MSKSRVMAGLAVSVAGVALAGVAAAWAFPLEAPARAEHGPAGGVAGVTSEAGAAAKKTAERRVVQKPSPAYPTDAKKKGVEGSVVLDVLITAAGDVKDVKVVKGPAELTESAMTAVRQWKYKAGPDDTRATLTVRYMLDKKKEGAPRP